VIALGAEVIRELFLVDPVLGIAVAAIVVTSLLALYGLYRMRLSKR
jgi:hypothetical protein